MVWKTKNRTNHKMHKPSSFSVLEAWYTGMLSSKIETTEKLSKLLGADPQICSNIVESRQSPCTVMSEESIDSFVKDGIILPEEGKSLTEIMNQIKAEFKKQDEIISSM